VSRNDRLSAFHEANYEQQNYGADRGVNDGSNNSPTDHDAQRTEHPTADECANNAYDDVANEPKSDPFDDDASESAGDRADDDEDDQCLQ
jgi:hypothetical protein